MEKIRKAKPEDLESVYHIISRCAMLLSEHGFSHWDNYKSYEIVKQHFENHEVYLLEVDDQPVATISINYTQPDYYKFGYEDKFSSPSTKPNSMYLNKLAVLPLYQRKGLGKKLMQYCEKLAKEKKLVYIRFDARAEMNSLTSFYSKLDYTVVGQVLEEDQLYNVYEKNLS